MEALYTDTSRPYESTHNVQCLDERLPMVSNLRYVVYSSLDPAFAIVAHKSDRFETASRGNDS